MVPKNAQAVLESGDGAKDRPSAPVSGVVENARTATLPSLEWTVPSSRSRFDVVHARTSRAVGKAKRICMGLPGVRQVSLNQYHARLGQYAFLKPWLPRELHENIESIRRTGVATTRLALPPKVLRVAERLVDLLMDAPRDARFDRISASALLEPADVFLFGLDEANLDMAESFIGLPVLYAGCELKRERPEAPPVDVRMWHIDVEDHRMLKVIVYLSDVDEECGPFTHLDVTDTNRAKEALRYRSGFVTDDAMAEILPRSAWRTATGARLTATYVDTCNLFHKAAQPRSRDRYSVTFSYTSTTPLQLFPEFRHTREQSRSVKSRLSARQLRALGID